MSTTKSKKTTKTKKSTQSKKKSTQAKKTSPKATKSAIEKKGEENREDLRVPVQLLVDYHSEGHYLFDFCKDLGVGGVFIQTKTPLDKGSSIELTFTIPDSMETLKAKGEVIWVQNSAGKGSNAGMGVQFHKFDSKQRKTLEEFVQRYSDAKDIFNPETSTIQKTA